MEKYKKSLIYSCIKLAILSALLIVVFLIFGTTLVIPSLPKMGYSNKDMISMMGGGVVGFVAVEIYAIVSWLHTIKNPQKLNAMYIKTNDERELLIQQKTGFSTFVIVVYLLLMAAVISSRINSDICFTLFVVIIAMMVIYGASNLYYRKKF